MRNLTTLRVECSCYVKNCFSWGFSFIFIIHVRLLLICKLLMKCVSNSLYRLLTSTQETRWCTTVQFYFLFLLYMKGDQVKNDRDGLHFLTVMLCKRDTGVKSMYSLLFLLLPFSVYWGSLFYMHLEFLVFYLWRIYSK